MQGKNEEEEAIPEVFEGFTFTTFFLVSDIEAFLRLDSMKQKKCSCTKLELGGSSWQPNGSQLLDDQTF